MAVSFRRWLAGRRFGNGLRPSKELIAEWTTSDWPDYHAWLQAHSLLTLEAWDGLRASALDLADPPYFAILTPVFNPQPAHLLEAVLSVRLQSYPYWRLYLVDDASHRPETRDLLVQLARSDRRISLVSNQNNQGISRATNRALQSAFGDYVVFLDHDDRLYPDALSCLAEALFQEPALDLLYSDRDVLAPNGQRIMHQLKPGWSPELVLSNNYLFHLTCYRIGLIRALGGYRPAYDGSQDYDLLLRAAELSLGVRHIPRVLYQWRQQPSSIALNHASKGFVYRAGVSALIDAAGRRGIDCDVEEMADLWPGNYRLVPRGKPEFDLVCLPTDLEAERYASYLDNAFAHLGSKDIVVVLAEDLFATSHTAVQTLASFLEQLPEVAMVTGRVIDPQGHIVHAGLFHRRDGIPMAPYLRYPESTSGYMAITRVLRNVSAPWPWCFAVRRSALEAARGIDLRFQGPHAALDLGLRILTSDFGRMVFVPDARFVAGAPPEPESPILDGQMPDPCPPVLRQVPQDREMFCSRWSDWLRNGDPYLNPGLSDAAVDLRLRSEVEG